MNLAEKTIYLWLLDLNTTNQDKASLQELLSPRERQIAQRFRLEQHRNRYIVTHGRLRQILGHCTGELPKSLQFLLGRGGKPQLYGPYPCLRRIRFNLSHSAHLALIGVTLDADIGVDLEVIRPLNDLSVMANTWFSASDIADLATLQGNERINGFYRCWTRKEAFLKALGQGLTHPLNAFHISFKSTGQAQVVAMGNHQSREQRLWSIFDITPHSNFLGAVVAQGHDLQLVHCQF